MKRILHVVGARPNFMKVAPIMREMAKYPDAFEQILVQTGQDDSYIVKFMLSKGYIPQYSFIHRGTI